MIDFKEIKSGETWELFARDFLQELGYVVDVSPDRGPDGGRDLIVTEDFSGIMGDRKFKWLTSCKHYAKSEKSVSERNELNILERVAKFSANGFMGFYSTLPSSGLNSSLSLLKEKGKIEDVIIFDASEIESKLVRKVSAGLLKQHLPEAYKKMKPVQLIVDEYLPLECGHCGKDLLQEKDLGLTLIGFVEDFDEKEGKKKVKDIYWAHKGECDRVLRYSAQAKGYMTGWNDIADLVAPIFFVKFILSIINRLRDGKDVYTDMAIANLRHFIVAISQKSMREVTGEERERFKSLMEFPWL